LSASPGAEALDSSIFRLAADFFKFDGTEFTTTTTAVAGPSIFVPGTLDGALFYTKKVSVPKGSNTLYVSIYATGDTHFGAAEWLSCRAAPQASPGIAPFCRPSADPTAIDQAPSGWISLLKLPQDVQTPNGANNCNASGVGGDGGGGSADCHDNAIAYQWCVPVRGDSVVTVNLRMATSINGRAVFIEKGHVYIDSSHISQTDRCALLGDDPLAAALKAAVATGEEVAGSTTPGQQ